MSVRKIALEVIESVIFKKQSLNNLLPDAKKRVKSNDVALLQMLVFGILREYHSLSSLRDSLIDIKLKDKDKNYIEIILNLGIFQLLRLDLGDHAVLNETVELAKYYKLLSAKSLINAILRRVQRSKEHYLHELNRRSVSNIPLWLAKSYPDRLIKLSKAQIQQAPFTLRIRGDRDAWLEKNAAIKNPLSKTAVTIKHGVQLNDICGFSSGDLSVQDAAAQNASLLLNPQNSEYILDACCAPGGKTGHILELAPQARVLGLDIDEKRLNSVRENLHRLNVSAKLRCANAADLDSWYDGEEFDAILLDAPCSGSGVIRRHPDILFLRNKEDIQQYSKLQMKLLTNLWKILKPNGRLLYTTCSILARENQLLIEQFVLKNKDAVLRKIDLPLCEDTGHGLLHFPDEHGDGFFYALLDKKAN